LGGVTINVNAGMGNVPATTDSRGAYEYIATSAVPSTVTINPSTLPKGVVLTSSSTQSFDLNNCRSGQVLNFATQGTTPVRRITFGRAKSFYR